MAAKAGRVGPPDPQGLHELDKVAGDRSGRLYDRNRAVYELLRYGVNVLPGVGQNSVTVWLVDWAQPDNNHFAIAEEVPVKGAQLANAAKAATKRPDVALYVNGRDRPPRTAVILEWRDRFEAMACAFAPGRRYVRGEVCGPSRIVFFNARS